MPRSRHKKETLIGHSCLVDVCLISKLEMSLASTDEVYMLRMIISPLWAPCFIFKVRGLDQSAIWF